MKYRTFNVPDDRAKQTEKEIQQQKLHSFDLDEIQAYAFTEKNQPFIAPSEWARIVANNRGYLFHPEIGIFAKNPDGIPEHFPWHLIAQTFEDLADALQEHGALIKSEDNKQIIAVYWNRVDELVAQGLLP